MKTKVATVNPFINVTILCVADARYLMAKSDKFDLSLKMEGEETPEQALARFRLETKARIEREHHFDSKLTLAQSALSR